MQVTEKVFDKQEATGRNDGSVRLGIMLLKYKPEIPVKER